MGVFPLERTHPGIQGRKVPGHPFGQRKACCTIGIHGVSGLAIHHFGAIDAHLWSSRLWPEPFFVAFVHLRVCQDLTDLVEATERLEIEGM